MKDASWVRFRPWAVSAERAVAWCLSLAVAAWTSLWLGTQLQVASAVGATLACLSFFVWGTVWIISVNFGMDALSKARSSAHPLRIRLISITGLLIAGMVPASICAIASLMVTGRLGPIE